MKRQRNEAGIRCVAGDAKQAQQTCRCARLGVRRKSLAPQHEEFSGGSGSLREELFMLKMLAFVLAAAGSVQLATPPAYAKQEISRAPLDPNQKVCEEIIPTGSRLGVRRICATRAEWADKRRQDRDAIDKAQLSPCVIQTTSSRGKPSC